jgi:hypothetical protein
MPATVIVILAVRGAELVFAVKFAAKVPFPVPETVGTHQAALLVALQTALEVMANVVEPEG